MALSTTALCCLAATLKAADSEPRMLTAYEQSVAEAKPAFLKLIERDQ
jgi:hypothetical protein